MHNQLMHPFLSLLPLPFFFWCILVMCNWSKSHLLNPSQRKLELSLFPFLLPFSKLERYPHLIPFPSETQRGAFNSVPLMCSPPPSQSKTHAHFVSLPLFHTEKLSHAPGAPTKLWSRVYTIRTNVFYV